MMAEARQIEEERLRSAIAEAEKKQREEEERCVFKDSQK